MFKNTDIAHQQFGYVSLQIVTDHIDYSVCKGYYCYVFLLFYTSRMHYLHTYLFGTCFWEYLLSKPDQDRVSVVEAI